ncbi:hypothetical protein EDC61_102228 [Sulfuritortus calidifontis]|uniref:Uncharacterized protein n=1 Tax=Sulfuritortus calidifontis TaxID=1914471 RepID=A0A4R3K0I6_9PROT|nr:hypothetical protein [Sulfuritortus calidifontis]TCS73451.1 hypothetical protein EDC61_102228 [Sulfuritortus calidifontis]
MRLTVRSAQAVLGAPNWQASQPLWQRVPKRDAEGQRLADFMMIAPALKGRDAEELAPWLTLVEGVLKRFDSAVVFADFNLQLNLLWVSHRCRPGLGSELVAALRAAAPQLRLVGHVPDMAG